MKIYIKLNEIVKLEKILSTPFQDIAYFDDPYHGTGQLTSRLATDASKVKGATSSRISVLVQVSFTAAAALGVAFYYSWKLTLLVMAFVPFLVFGGIMRASRFKNFAAKEGKRLLDASAVSLLCFFLTFVSDVIPMFWF